MPINENISLIPAASLTQAAQPGAGLRPTALMAAGNTESTAAVIQATLDLLAYCRSMGWAGYDPYDGLTSPLFDRLPFLRNSAARLVFIQFMKRSLINFRPLAGIAPGRNPKGLALFLSSLVRLWRLGLVSDEGQISTMAQLLLARRTPGQAHAGWGYNFDWQTRTSLVPKYTPNVICTSFAGNALLDAFDLIPEPSWLEAARSAGTFLLKGLNISRGAGRGICFSYTPLDNARVHNANLLAAAYLARLFSKTGEQELLDHALAAARYSVDRQSPDGSWPYGEGKNQAWIDNFHTGYNLTALRAISRSTGIDEFEPCVASGFAFYRAHFFEDGGVPRYYHDKLYPIDIHAAAQSIVTLADLADLGADNIDLAHAVCSWALRTMRDPAGFFYYQKKKLFTNRIPYMRWSQAWMLFSLATFLGHILGQPESQPQSASGDPMPETAK